MPTILLPAALRRLLDKPVSTVPVSASTVGEALTSLVRQHPALMPVLFDSGYQLRRFVRIYVGEDPIERLDGLTTRLRDGDELMLLPPIAGG
jgi:sulfur-carrier protein